MINQPSMQHSFLGQCFEPYFYEVLILCPQQLSNHLTNKHLLNCQLIGGMFTLANNEFIKHLYKGSLSIIDPFKRPLIAQLNVIDYYSLKEVTVYSPSSRDQGVRAELHIEHYLCMAFLSCLIFVSRSIIKSVIQFLPHLVVSVPV